MTSALRSAVLFSLFSLALVSIGVPACSQQGEGERCDKTKNGNADCDGGLVCTAAGLLDGDVDRCCPPAAESSNDSRCHRSTGSGRGGSGGSSTAGSGGTSPAAGDSSGAGEGSTGGVPTGGTGSATPEGGTASGGAPAQTDGGTSSDAGASQLPVAGQGGAG